MGPTLVHAHMSNFAITSPNLHKTVTVYRYKWHSFHSPVLTVSVRTGHSCGHTCTIDLATCTTWLSNYLILSFPYGMDGRVLWTCTHVPLHLVVLSFPHYMTWQSYRHSTHVYLHDLSFPFFTHGIRDGTVVCHYHRNRGGARWAPAPPLSCSWLVTHANSDQWCRLKSSQVSTCGSVSKHLLSSKQFIASRSPTAENAPKIAK